MVQQGTYWQEQRGGGARMALQAPERRLPRSSRHNSPSFSVEVATLVCETCAVTVLIGGCFYATYRFVQALVAVVTQLF